MNKNRNPTFSFGDREEGENRLRELMLYVVNRCGTDGTWFNKVLWWSDFLAFAEHGEPITGVEYQNSHLGPAPKHRRSILNVLMSNGDAVFSAVYGFVPLRMPNLAVFTVRQVALVNRVIAERREETHIAWKVGGYGDSIPYEAIFLLDAPVSSSDIARAKELGDPLTLREMS